MHNIIFAPHVQILIIGMLFCFLIVPKIDVVEEACVDVEFCTIPLFCYAIFAIAVIIGLLTGIDFLWALLMSTHILVLASFLIFRIFAKLIEDCC